MFAVQTDSTQTVVGVELATQPQYVSRHKGDPTWFFVDGDRFWDKYELSAFMVNPCLYYIDDTGVLRLNYNL